MNATKKTSRKKQKRNSAESADLTVISHPSSFNTKRVRFNNASLAEELQKQNFIFVAGTNSDEEPLFDEKCKKWCKTE